MAGDRTLKLSLLADTKNLVDGLNKGQKESQTFGDKIDNINRKVGLAFAAMGAAATAMALKFTKDAIGAASDMEETVAKIGVIFGESAKEIDKFAATAATNLGQSKQQALDAAANFAIFGKAAGLSGKALVDFSVGLVALASDLASFNNTTPEDAINAIGAALRGEAEPLRRYGVLLNDATLKVAALELGIYSGVGALTAQQKVLAAQKVILEQTNIAQGDFARTSDGLANSQRQIAASVADAQAQLGEALLPVMLQLATFTENVLVPALSSFIDGLTGKGGLKQGLTESQKSAEEFGKRARKVFDVIVDLKEVALVTAGVLTTMFVVSKIQAAVVVVINLIKGLVVAYNALRVSAMAAGIAAAFALNPALGIAAGTAAIAGMGLLIQKMNKQSGAITGSIFTGGNTVPAASLPSGFTSGTTIPKPAGTPQITQSASASGTTRTTNAPSVASAPTILKPSGNAIPSSFDVAAARAGEEQDRPIVINVNAPSVIDETGFTRAVQLAIQNTQQRGGGGAGFALNSMTVFTPDWRVKINETTVTAITLVNLTITSGRQTIYEQPSASYCNVTLNH
jgi:hypothetical protein